MIERLLARVPQAEVAVRLAYWRNPLIHRLGNAVRERRAAKARSAPPAVSVPADFADVIAASKQLGVKAGDILIVHSSMGALKPFGLGPAEIIARLRDLLGPDGTLAMPTIPLLAGDPEGLDRHSDAAQDRLFEYDVASKRIWTGALPKALMDTPGAVRSRCPGNSLTAVGPHAEAMMRDNIARPAPSPCGPDSSWAYCWRNGAKIVAIGVDLVHSLTMIHVAEECFPERWTISDWFRTRRYHVKDGAFETEIGLRERKHGWSQYYAERAFSRDLFKSGVAVTASVGPLDIHYCEAQRLIQFLTSHPRPFYPYVFPFGIRSSGSKA